MIYNAKGYEIQEAIESNEVVLLDFWAPWCGPCKVLGPTLELIDAQVPGVQVVKVNVDEDPAAAAEYGVMGVPSMFFFKNGERVKQINGAQPFDKLKSIIEEIQA